MRCFYLTPQQTLAHATCLDFPQSTCSSLLPPPPAWYALLSEGMAAPNADLQAAALALQGDSLQKLATPFRMSKLDDEASFRPAKAFAWQVWCGGVAREGMAGGSRRRR